MWITLSEWVFNNKTELIGAVLGICYVILSIRQNILTWPVGLSASALYIIVFFNSALYASMGLQVYYVIISIYGWHNWLKGKTSNNKSLAPIRQFNSKLWIKTGFLTLCIYAFILFLLLNFSDSDVPFLDSFITTLSIVATWMLAKKYIENWLIWIFADLISAGLYIFKNLWPTSVLFVVYTAMAVMGYFEWKHELKPKN